MTKFKQGDKVIHNGEELEVITMTKNFTTGVIKYRLSNKMMVNEGELKGVNEGKKEPKSALKILSDKYQELYGKNVPSSRKNNEEWIQKKVNEKLEPVKQKNTVPGLNWSDLKELEASDLLSIIESKKLDIDPEDYTGDEDGLREAIAEQLNVQVTD